MPDMRSGVRRSKRVNNVQGNPSIVVTTVRPGTGKGKGSKATVLKSTLKSNYPSILLSQSRPGW
jgi:folylpolyglutamate synthase/dihydropteroate synthase